MQNQDDLFASLGVPPKRAEQVAQAQQAFTQALAHAHSESDLRNNEGLALLSGKSATLDAVYQEISALQRAIMNQDSGIEMQGLAEARPGEDEQAAANRRMHRAAMEDRLRVLDAERKHLEASVLPPTGLASLTMKAIQPIPPYMPRRAYSPSEKQFWLNRAHEVGFKEASKELSEKWNVHVTGALSMIKKWRKKKDQEEGTVSAYANDSVFDIANPDMFLLWMQVKEFFTSFGFGIAASIIAAAVNTCNTELFYFDNNVQLALNASALSIQDRPLYALFRDLRAANVTPTDAWNYIQLLIQHLVTRDPAMLPPPPAPAPLPDYTINSSEESDIAPEEMLDDKKTQRAPMPVVRPMVPAVQHMPTTLLPSFSGFAAQAQMPSGMIPLPPRGPLAMMPKRVTSLTKSGSEQLDPRNPLDVLHLEKARHVNGYVAECNGYRAVYVPHAGKLLVYVENNNWKEMTGSEFERLAGRGATKKWKESVKLYLEGGGRVNVQRWLVSQEVAAMSPSSTATGRPMLPLICPQPSESQHQHHPSIHTGLASNAPTVHQTAATSAHSSAPQFAHERITNLVQHMEAAEYEQASSSYSDVPQSQTLQYILQRLHDTENSASHAVSQVSAVPDYAMLSNANIGAPELTAGPDSTYASSAMDVTNNSGSMIMPSPLPW